MKIGMVCPYSWDVPGGVQQHIRDLAEALIDEGHEVSVISPADDDTPLPPYVVGAGRAVPVPYNGSVARLSFGFLSVSRVRRWINQGGFDVLHVHEPEIPVPADGTRQEQIAAMTQELASTFEAAITEHPQDWHMLQRVFTDDLDPARLAAAVAREGSG